MSRLATFRPACFASALIPAGVMSGEPTMSSFLRLELTVERPLTPITIAAIPNAIRTAAASTPPSSNTLRITSPSVAADLSVLDRPVLVSDGRPPSSWRHPRRRGIAARESLAQVAEIPLHLHEGQGRNLAAADDQHRAAGLVQDAAGD